MSQFSRFRLLDTFQVTSTKGRRPVRIGLHLTLMVLGEMAGFVLGALALIAVLPRELASSPIPLYLAVIAGGAFAGALGVCWQLHRVGARCPDCGGRAVPEGVSPICYRCEQSGHFHETPV